MYIETERLVIRPFTKADIEPSCLMNLDADVSKYTADGGVVSKQEIERRIVEHVLGDYQKHGFGRLAVEEKGKNKFIGFTGLKYLEDLEEVDLGYRFMKKYWGKGYATESGRAMLELGFHKLKLDRIIASLLPENISSINVLKKLNFQFEKEYWEEENILAHQYELRKTNYLSRSEV